MLTIPPRLVVRGLLNVRRWLHHLADAVVPPGSLWLLGTMRRAMQPGSRVVICETLVELMDTALPGSLIEVQMMMVCCGGVSAAPTSLSSC